MIPIIIAVTAAAEVARQARTASAATAARRTRVRARAGEGATRDDTVRVWTYRPTRAVSDASQGGGTGRTGTLPGMTTPPPGWYPGPTGAPQWWDGRGWGPTAPPPSDTSNTMALFAHLGTFIGGFLVPLIIRQTEGTKNRFVKHHATEALNWSITTAIASLVLVVVYVVGILVSVAGAAGTGNAAGFGAFFAVIVVVVVAALALSVTSIAFVVIGAVKASQRRYWRYPVAIRFVPGAASKEEVDALNRGSG